MIYKNLGNTGLKVSSLCLGTMTFADGADPEECQNIYAECRDKGVNFFDCADVYADGESERILGNLVKAHRSDVIITTKAFYPTGGDINARGLSRHHLTHALHSSLKALRTDYIDVYYFHSFDVETPLIESLAAISKFVRDGAIRYLGLSNFASWQVMKAVHLAADFPELRIACVQPMYNLIKRQCEAEILPMAASEGLGVVSYSPLAGGLLTGKYLGSNRGNGRFDESEMYQRRYQSESSKRIVEAFLNLAVEFEVSPVSLAVAWVSSHPDVTAPIIGARTLDQLRLSLESLNVGMTEDRRKIVSALSPPPGLPTDREEERDSVNV